MSTVEKNKNSVIVFIFSRASREYQQCKEAVHFLSYSRATVIYISMFMAVSEALSASVMHRSCIMFIAWAVDLGHHDNNV